MDGPLSAEYPVKQVNLCTIKLNAVDFMVVFQKLFMIYVRYSTQSDMTMQLTFPWCVKVGTLAQQKGVLLLRMSP